jgi:hypothetical protein
MHTLVLPLMVGTVGDVPTVTALLPLLLPQVLVMVKVTLPDTAVLLHVVVMLLVP